MRRGHRTLLIVAGAAAICAAGTVVAYAHAAWPIPGVALVKARTATMPKGVTPSAAKQGGAAVISWSAQEIAPGAKMDHYVVTAHSVEEPPLPEVAHTVAASGDATESITFAAGEVAGGKWSWTLVPRLGLWAGAESGKSQKLDFPVPTVNRLAAAPPTVTATTAPTVTTTTPATTPATVPPTPTTPPVAEATATIEPTPIPEKTAAGESAPADAAE